MGISSDSKHSIPRLAPLVSVHGMRGVGVLELGFAECANGFPAEWLLANLMEGRNSQDGTCIWKMVLWIMDVPRVSFPHGFHFHMFALLFSF
jgi:hypothetical protein